MTVNPVGNRLLIKQSILSGEETTNFGLIVAPKESQKLPLGLVIAIGSEVKDIKIGDTVMFEGWTGDPVSEDMGGDTNLLIIKADRIIATYEK